MKYLIVIAGPTAIGKTALSISLAKHYRCEIISSDSRQFYREMSIGTAVPSRDELSEAPHHFIQNISIFDSYTVGDYERDALRKLDELFARQDMAIMVGGSGLYIDAVLKGFDTFPEIDSAVRETIRKNYAHEGLPYLQEKLKEKDPEYFTTISASNPQTLMNPQRMMRFVEVCESTGKPYSSFLKKEKKKRDFVPILIGLDAERINMYDRINRRVDLMMDEGLLNEAQRLYEFKKLNALQTVGYKELFEFIEKQKTLSEAVEEIKKNTRNFAKRQLTWFRKNDEIKWFHYLTRNSEIIQYIDATAMVHQKYKN